jgi:predicted transposase YbfD/YdcC
VHDSKKVDAVAVESGDEAKQTNEIGTFIPLLNNIDIQGKDITADALLTQRKLASFVVARKAHYHFTVKGNQATLKNDIALLFENRKKPDFVEITPPNHGRIETRRIWCSTALNEYLDFPHVGQVFLIERETLHKKTVKITHEVVLGITSRTPEQASPQRILKVNRGHRTIKNRCHYVIDWNFDEDRSRIRTGHGPENVTRLRRFGCSVIQLISKGKSSVSQKMQQLNRNTRLVFDYLPITSNSTRTRSL